MSRLLTPPRRRRFVVTAGLVALVAGACTLLASGCATETLVSPTAQRLPAAQPPAVTVADDAVREETVTYTPAGWPEAQQADLYVPETPGAGLRPAVIMVHGGGWIRGSRTEMSGYGRLTGPVAERGFVVMNVSYRLAPQWPDPAAREDLVQAVAYLRANAARLRIDPARVGVWGYSAGAHLALLLAEDLRDKGLPPLAAVVAGGTPGNLTAYPDNFMVKKYFGTDYATDAARWQNASPLLRINDQLPPVFLYQGTQDWTVDPSNTEHLVQALTQAGVPNEVVWVKGAGHVATFLFGRDAVAQGIDFLDRTLRPAG